MDLSQFIFYSLKLHIAVEVDPLEGFQSSQVLSMWCYHSFSGCSEDCHVITLAGSNIVTTGHTC